MNIPQPELRTRRADDDARMLPLVNLVFLLLVFFMLAGALSAPAAFRVQPPASRQAGSVEGSARALLIAADGRLAYGTDSLSPAALDAFATEWQAQHPNAALAVQADAAADAPNVLRILDRLRRAGIERVVLMTAHDDGR